MDSIAKDIYKNYIRNQFTRIEGFDFSNTQLLKKKLEKEYWLTYKPSYEPYMPANKQAKILELGTGFGRFAFFCHQLGFTNFEGVDLSGDGIKICREMFPNYTFANEDFKTYLDRSAESFDVIFLSHVIEHIQKKDMSEFLDSLRKKLNEGGVLIIATPNASAYFGAARLRYIDFTHETAFTPESLEEILSISAFKIIATSNRKMNLPFYKSFVHQSVKFFFELIIAGLGYCKENVYTPDFFTVSTK